MPKQFALVLLAFAAYSQAQTAGSFTSLTATGQTYLNTLAVPAATAGSGALRVGSGSSKLELGANQIQAYGNGPGLLTLNSLGGAVRMFSGAGNILFSPTYGPAKSACLDINTNMANCGQYSYNLHVNGPSLLEGSLTVTGNGTVQGNLNVNGAIYVGTSGWSIAAPDYVFASDYKLSSLEETEAYVKENRHLPGVESANGFEKDGATDLVKMNLVLLEKVEELTLHAIELNKRVKELEAKN